ncbi:TetR/AcrR family transcriptional regulator [Agreia sp. VKM Ac-1783]|uniref:TetR/AcrR family transcriptional regulator n=1 Tax=Agreia sp. VKM Ac-1783 TaxID=1938889 RepID=UPI000A2AD032|nr:TetR/AcrR family transcriptional regulator [Agreia sp. VKM Ac-1783]SMQ73912.1 transcriptional regulator, TetR family [Agreia sp. VKM Ac-1783]
MNASRSDSPTRRTGRPIDRSSDALVLSSALELLAERDYERFTVDEVAARTGKAKTTLYRRWPTKEDLVLAAISAIGRPPELDALPETGSLRSDLLAVIDSPWLGGASRRTSIFASLIFATRNSERIARAVRAEVTEPYVDIYRRILSRAANGQDAADRASRIRVLAEVIPAMSTHRLGSGSESPSRDFFVSVVDEVVLPALMSARP